MLHSALPPRERLAAWRRLRAARSASRSARARRCSRRCARSASSSSTRSTTRRSSRRRACATTRATWRWCARSAPARSRSSARRRRRSRARYNVARGRFTRLLAARARDAAAAARGRDRRSAPPPARPATGCCRRRCAEAIGATLAAGEQSILFLNRRGFSTLRALPRVRPRRPLPELLGVADLPPRPRRAWSATTAAASQHVPERCPSCASTRLERMGIGTERVEAIVRERFPDARVARLDRDTAGERRGGQRAGRDPGAHARGARSTSWSARRW